MQLEPRRKPGVVQPGSLRLGSKQSFGRSPILQSEWRDTPRGSKRYNRIAEASTYQPEFIRTPISRWSDYGARERCNSELRRKHPRSGRLQFRSSGALQ
eukprot:5732531-Alexandrium_andersonii.AAC.1